VHDDRPDLDALGLLAAQTAPPLAEAYYVGERITVRLPDRDPIEVVVTDRTPTTTGLRLATERVA
jgi:hypothetical protein